MIRFSPEIYTPLVDESREFYCRWFGFRIKLEMDGFVVLQHTDKPDVELMFCIPDSPFVNELFHSPYCGSGLIFQIEVKDVDAEYERIRKSGLLISLHLVEEPVNGRHFTVTDPNGIHLDLVQFTKESKLI